MKDIEKKINDKDMEKVTGGVVASGGIHVWHGSSGFIGGPDEPLPGIHIGDISGTLSMADTPNLTAYDPHDEQIL